MDEFDLASVHYIWFVVIDMSPIWFQRLVEI